MGINKSQKKLSEYRKLIGVREGLSFSEWGNDDRNSYEVKPPQMMRPMDEADWPIQARDLFGNGLHEDNLKVSGHDCAWYWMDRKGELFPVPAGEEAYSWAQNFLSTNGIESDENDALEKMYELGFIIIFACGGVINYEYNPHKKPNPQQIQSLLKASIDSNYHLYDKTKHVVIRDSDTNKTFLKEGKIGGRIFILEHMMPEDTDTFKSHLTQLFQYLQKELQLKTIPRVKLLSDQKNADKVLGKTAYYDSDKRTICLYETNRHQKDILRSFAHEVIHHWQHENEKFQTISKNTGKEGESPQTQDPQYAQKDPWLRQMEKQAYLLGNILFRDWEDKKKNKDRQSSKRGV